MIGTRRATAHGPSLPNVAGHDSICIACVLTSLRSFRAVSPELGADRYNEIQFEPKLQSYVSWALHEVTTRAELSRRVSSQLY